MKRFNLKLLAVLTLMLVMGASAYGGLFDKLFGKKEKADDTIKIGFLLKTMQEERYQKDKAYFIEKAESLGAEVIFDSSNNNEQTQLSMFENMIAKGADVIVIQPVNTGTAGNMVKMAEKEGVRVVGYDSMLQDGPLETHIMHDAKAVGVLEGEQLVKWLMDKKGKVEGKVAIIKGQAGDSYAIELSSGVKEVLSQYPGIEIVAEQFHEGWSPDLAMATAENVLARENNDIDAFLCNNSGLARGVISALAAQNLDSSDKVFVAGADADLVNVRYVAQGVQAMEVYAAIQPLAETAAETAYKLAANKDTAATELLDGYKLVDNGYQDVVTVYADIFLVDQDTIEDTVVKFGYLSKDDIYAE